MKRLSILESEILKERVEEYIKDVNSWDYEAREEYVSQVPITVRQVIASAVYAFGWRYNTETDKYEREENNS